MLITAQQIKAGRALIDWSAEQLGDRVGLTKAGISRIETGRSSGSVEVLSRIIYALQSGGVEFTEDGGVRPRQSRITIYRGHDGFCSFFDDVYEVAKTHQNPDISITNVSEEIYDHWLGSYEAIHTKRMLALQGVKLHVLVKDTPLISSAYSEYRWIPASRFADVSLYIYGDKVAFIEFAPQDVTVTVVESSAVTEAQRKMFDLAWDQASTSPNP